MARGNPLIERVGRRLAWHQAAHDPDHEPRNRLRWLPEVRRWQAARQSAQRANSRSCAMPSSSTVLMVTAASLPLTWNRPTDKRQKLAVIRAESLNKETRKTKPEILGNQNSMMRI